MFIKTSILSQYIRISLMRWERRLLYAAIFVVVAEGINWIILLFAGCAPIYAQWRPDVPIAWCINQTVSFYVCSATTISADVFILIMPPILLRHTLFPWRQKLVIGIVLAFGGV
jgi:hypothetical protein